MALVSPNSPHAELIQDPDQPTEDEDTSTPQVSSFDPSSRGMTVTSNPGSVIHPQWVVPIVRNFVSKKTRHDQTPVNAQETLRTKWNSLSTKSD